MALFQNHTLDDHADSLAHYLPGGRLFEAKFIQGKNLRYVLRAIAAELQRFHTLMEEIASDYDIRYTQNLINQWESALGIPGTCFDNNGTIEERRRNVLIKLTKLHGTTVEDLVNLAQLLGYKITVETGRSRGMFPMTFPIQFFPNGLTPLFTMIISLPNSNKPSVFPLTFPIQFANPNNALLVCLFNRIKPANVAVLYRYVSA